MSEKWSIVDANHQHKIIFDLLGFIWNEKNNLKTAHSFLSITHNYNHYHVFVVYFGSQNEYLYVYGYIFNHNAPHLMVIQNKQDDIS